MKHGYVERVGNAYRVTDKVNIPELRPLIDQALAALEKRGSKQTARLSLSQDPVRPVHQ